MAKVLLVHGDAVAAKTTARELEERGHRVTFETVAHRAWRSIREDTPDVLIVSLSPTGNPGLDAASATKVGHLGGLPIVFYDEPERLRADVCREYPRASVVPRDSLLDTLPQATG